MVRQQHAYQVDDHLMLCIPAKDRKNKYRNIANGPFTIVTVQE
ncbi:hypothetical protein L917_13282 [Phytophthora nicotianae]|uniref:Uncharacterized protein n=1 Tax=Phytophthora nicotianae TaxID=4792 RepID=W2KQX3_PHYNI|nr:hypothetical protein L915_13573 [Phytophthora nicotianae]ETL87563.1 hypothetical protein L917_13282 [Phytophthora nicotianae]